LKFVSLQGNKEVEIESATSYYQYSNLYPRNILCRPNYATCYYVSSLKKGDTTECHTVAITRIYILSFG